MMFVSYACFGRSAAIARPGEYKQAVTTTQLSSRTPKKLTVLFGTADGGEAVPLSRHPTTRPTQRCAPVSQLMVLSANIVRMKRVPWVAFSSRWYGVVGLAHRSREVDWKAKTRAGRSTQEETRRGRVGAMHVVAAARTFWVCGTEKCPCEFATDGVCGGS